MNKDLMEWLKLHPRYYQHTFKGPEDKLWHTFWDKDELECGCLSSGFAISDEELSFEQ